MKKTAITIAISLGVLLPGMAQKSNSEKKNKRKDSPKMERKTDIVTIEYDYASDLFNYLPRKEKVKPGQYVRFKVVNVNKSTHDVEINKSEVNYHVDIPDEFKSNLIAGGKEEQKEEVSDQIDGGSIEGSGKKKVESQISDTKDLIQKLQWLTELHRDLLDLYESEDLNINNLVQKKKEVITNPRYFPEMNECETACHVTLKRHCEERYDLALKSINESIDYIKLMNSYAETVTYFISTKAKIEAIDYQKMFQEISELYKGLNEHLFSARSEDLVLVRNQTDVITFSVDIKPKEEFKANNPGSTKFDTELYVTGLKVDFSAGMIFTGVTDEKYTTDANNNIVSENEDKVEFNLGTLVHLSYRFDKNLASGLNLGVSLDTDERPRYLVGGSLLLGRKERIVISVGAAYGKRNVLSSSQEVGNEVSSTDDIKLVEQYDLKGFFSLTYNLNLIK